MLFDSVACRARKDSPCICRRDGSMILFDSKHGTHPEESDTVYVYTSGDTSEVWFTDTVPEPAEWLLLASGVAGTALLGRLRERR